MICFYLFFLYLLVGKNKLILHFQGISYTDYLNIRLSGNFWCNNESIAKKITIFAETTLFHLSIQTGFKFEAYPDNFFQNKPKTYDRQTFIAKKRIKINNSKQICYLKKIIYKFAIWCDRLAIFFSFWEFKQKGKTN